MKLFIIAWNNANPDYLTIMSGLEEAGHEIVYWTGLCEEKFAENKKQFRNAIFHSHREAVFGIPPAGADEFGFDPPSEDLLKKLYETESHIPTILRNKFETKSDLEKKHLYHKYVQYWHGALLKYKPDLIIFALWPHAGYDFVLYSIAKLLNIKTIMFEIVRIGDRLILINDFTVGSQLLKKELDENLKLKRNYKIEELSPDIRDFYKEQTSLVADNTPGDLKEMVSSVSGINKFKIKVKMVARSMADLTFFKKVFFFIVKKFKSNLKKEYTQLQTQPDFNKKYIYVALHYQPECSTNPLGGPFVDQILMVQILAASVPADWVIYVKEHPWQWKPRGTVYYSYRYENYYRELAGIPKVKLVPLKTDTFALINNAQAVATVTGTAGWEAVLRSKPALSFGHGWYRDCPGIFRVNSVESCKEIINRIISGSVLVKQQDIVNYLGALDRVSFHGYFEDWAKSLSKLSGDARAKSMFSALNLEINRIKK